MTWDYGPQTPDNNLMRFVAQRFRSADDTWFLDIGSGSGANTRELRERGYCVVSIDSDPNTEADEHVDISLFVSDRKFDCIFDINTLCHVSDPPFEKIRNLLKPSGIFFSICPTANTCERVKEGKAYTRPRHLSTPTKIVESLSMFSDVALGSAHYTMPRGDYYGSWIIEARP
jgi:SAM-dependent methyltransferase